MTKPMKLTSELLYFFENYSALDLRNFFVSDLADKIRKRDFGVQEKWTKICESGSVEKIGITVTDALIAGDKEQGYQVRCWADKDGHGAVGWDHVDSGTATCAMLFEFRIESKPVVAALGKVGINPPPGFVIKTEMILGGDGSKATKLTFVKENQKMS